MLWDIGQVQVHHVGIYSIFHLVSQKLVLVLRVMKEKSVRSFEI
jgi:hypothetical protein